MSKWARNRDANEKAIVKALRDAGASVQALDGRGVPDLLVGYQGRTLLIEVKQYDDRPGVGMKKNASGLRDTQQAWWASWTGCPPVVVTTEAEALAALGDDQ